MALCGNCGNHSTRILIDMTASGKLLASPRERCPHCDPESFQEPFAAPTDRRVWAEHLARPHLYNRMPDGSLRANDNVLSSIQDAFDADPDEEARQKAIARKRATRRTRPMTKTEIEQANREWAPIVKERYYQQAKAQRANEAALDAIVEKYMSMDGEGTKQ